MKKNMATETEVFEVVPLDQGKFDLTSSGRGEWTKEGTGKDQFFDPDKDRHREQLKSWSRAHWLATFKRSLMYGNRLTYHSCCNSFSRRAFAKASGHPELQSISVLQIPDLRTATSSDDLYK